MTTLLHDIDTLVKEKKFDQLKQELRSEFTRDMSDVEVGNILVASTEAYMQASNDLHQEYKDFLTSALATLKKIKVAETKVDDSEKLSKARNDLAS